MNILNKYRSELTSRVFQHLRPQLKKQGHSTNFYSSKELIMANLVFLSKENTPLTTSKIIADALNRQHGEVLKLCRKYKKQLSTFGAVISKKIEFHFAETKTDINSENLFKNQNYSFKTQDKTGRTTEVIYLNEQQATVLICLMRNSPKVLDFKLALVKAFFEMRQQLQLQNQPKTDSLPNYYTAEQIKELKDKARRQGFAMACAMFKKDENGLTERDRKQLEKAKAFIDWYSEKRVAIHDTWKLQRELTHELRELTYKLEQSGDLLSLLFGGYVGTLSEVSYYLNNKLQETNK